MSAFNEDSRVKIPALSIKGARVNFRFNRIFTLGPLFRSGISADTALRLGRYFGTMADVWINLQKRYELETARRELGKALEQIQPRAA